MKILLLQTRDGFCSHLLKTVSQLDCELLPAFSRTEAEEMLGAAQGHEGEIAAILPPRIPADPRRPDGEVYTGFELAEDFAHRYGTINILLLDGDGEGGSRPETPRLPPHIHGYIAGHAGSYAECRCLENTLLHAVHIRQLQREQQQLYTLLQDERRQRKSANVALDALESTVLLLTPEGRIIRMNQRGYELLGPPESSHGQLPFALLRQEPPADYPAPQAVKTMMRVSAELYIKALGGSLRITSIPIIDTPTLDGANSTPGHLVEVWEPRLTDPRLPLVSPSRYTDVPSPGPTRTQLLNRLTAREWELVPLLLRGDSYREAADALGVSLNTVKTHVGSIYRKTGCRRRPELVRFFHNLCP